MTACHPAKPYFGVETHLMSQRCNVPNLIAGNISLLTPDGTQRAASLLYSFFQLLNRRLNLRVFFIGFDVGQHLAGLIFLVCLD